MIRRNTVISLAEELSGSYDTRLKNRRMKGNLWRIAFYLATSTAVIALIILILNILNGAFGYVAIEYENDPASLARNGVSLEEMDRDQLTALMEEHLSKGLIRRYNSEQPLDERPRNEVYDIVVERIVDPHIIESWSLLESLFSKDEITAFAAGRDQQTWLQFRSWVNLDFIRKPQASVPEQAGIRTAILGSLWVILITILFAFPIGVGAAIYLEEFARDNRINRIIQVNIYNLAGVPSIIYGLLGLAIFVRLFEPLTSGALFGVVDPTTANGRTIFSAGLTLGLLVLPIIIINSQEAIRAVPQSIREASFGVGATRWRTVFNQVLPAAFDRILTGVILAVSRAIGETAPIVVVGASTFIAVDPKNVFSKFTTLPIQIYQWSARPQAEFRNVAAAAIIILLILLLSMNASAIVMRNRISKKRRLG